MYIYSLPYGKTNINIILPKKVDVYRPYEWKPTKSIEDLMYLSLENPIAYPSLYEFLRDKKDIAISIEDYTRPIDNRKILGLLFEYLRRKGLRDRHIIIVVATGLHKDNSLYDFSDLAYDFKIEILKHDPEKDLVFVKDEYLGEVGINKSFFLADAKIIIGDVLPHQIFGFSGPPKSIIPGLSDRSTIEKTHKAFLNHKLKAGQEKNIIRIWVESFSQKISNLFSINIVQNINNEIVDIKAGEIKNSFYEALKTCKKIYCVEITKCHDVVITSPGYPFDQDLYQTQKAFRHASYMTKIGGKIIVFAPCDRGWGSDSFRKAVEDDMNEDELKKNFTVGTHKLLFFLEIAKNYKLYLYSNIDFRIKNIEKFIELLNKPDLTQIIKESDDIAILIGGSYLVPILNE